MDLVNKRGGRFPIFNSRELTKDEHDSLKAHKVTWNLLMTICDIFLAGKANEYVYKAVEQAQEDGVYNQRMKMLLTNITKSSTLFHSESKLAARQDLSPAIVSSFPSLQNVFYRDGDPLLTSLQYEYGKVMGHTYQMLFYSCKNLCYKYSVKHPDILANIMVVRICCDIASDMCRDICKESAKKATSEYKVRITATPKDILPISQLNRACCSFIQEYARGMAYTDEHIDTAIKIIKKNFQGTTMAQIQEVALNRCVEDYGIFCVAYLLQMVKRGTVLSNHIVDDLVKLLGSMEDTKAFLTELKNMNIDVDKDVADIKEEIDFDRNKMCAKFLDLVRR